MKIKKGDNVKVIAGKDRGKTAKVSHALPKKDQVVLEGINVRQRHRRARKAGQKGEVVQIFVPMHISNVQLVCAKCGKLTRVGYKMVDKKKVRVCKKCGAEI